MAYGARQVQGKVPSGVKSLILLPKLDIKTSFETIVAGSAAFAVIVGFVRAMLKRFNSNKQQHEEQKRKLDDLLMRVDRLDSGHAQMSQSVRMLVHSNTMPMWEADQQGSIIYSNAAYERLTGREFDEIQGMGWVNLVHPEDRNSTIEVWDKSIAIRKPVSVRCRMFSNDEAGWANVKLHANPCLTPDGKIIGFYGTIELV